MGPQLLKIAAERYFRKYSNLRYYLQAKCESCGSFFEHGQTIIKYTIYADKPQLQIICELADKLEDRTYSDNLARIAEIGNLTLYRILLYYVYMSFLLKTIFFQSFEV